MDILSAPDWRLRQRFVMPGMKVEMNPVAVNIDADPDLELYVTPENLAGTGRAQLIKYNHATDGFDRIADIPAPWYTAGPAAAGDFDNDGKMEFISGNYYGYGLFESNGDSLAYVGQVGSPYDANTNYAVACRPKPGGILCPLLGFSQLDIGFRYQLLVPTGDNTFALDHEFAESTGWHGVPPSAAADMDCDGMDELVTCFYPLFKAWEWDVTSDSFKTGCVWSKDQYGTFLQFYTTDLDQNGVNELGTINHLNVFRTFESSCAVCTNPPSGLAAWWALDESFGATAHDSWSNHDGQYVGTPAYSSGKIGPGLRFGTPGEGVRVADASALNVGTGDFSVDAWILTTSPAPYSPILSKFEAGSNRGWAVWVDHGNRLAARLGDGTASDYPSGPQTIADGSWHHMAVTVDRDDTSGVKFYLDGNRIGAGNPTSRSGTVSNASDVRIGGGYAATGDPVFFSGTLDEVRLYRRALTLREVRSVLAADSLGNCKPSSVVCNCNQQGDVVADSVPDVFDVVGLIDYAFSGGTQPPNDPNCPHVDRGDVNCDGVDDVFDVVGLIDFVFSGGTPPCNPCACNPYPAGCP